MKEVFGYTSSYLTRNEKPWFPVMGEMHYSRYRESFWEESLRKMKAGGVSIVSSYVIWIHHEETEGVFDFSGCRDLGRFVSLCKKVGLYVFLRIGPWAHGEVRNGGFPDWVVRLGEEGVLLRSNDERYLQKVERYWKQVFSQVKGQMHEDGGPVIGIQIENEYGHVGGLRGEAGEAHMRTLTALAKRIGFRTPLYTATGWGGACIGDLLPVMGGYCDAPWDRSIDRLAPNANFVFSHLRNDALIANDHHTEDALTFDESRFPYLTAELGGGLQVTSHRRPVASGADVGAMSLVKLGSGAALLGYYMYHGGSNPQGRLSTLQESTATGYLNDLPEINYDFNAPLRQYGTISDAYREIRLLACFLKDFGEDLAALPAAIRPADVRPDDLHTLRCACRHDGTHGYVFFNNYQRLYPMERHENVELEGICEGGPVRFPPMEIDDGRYGFFPYRMRLGDTVLRFALATPLCRLQGRAEDWWVFYGDWAPQFCWEGKAQERILHLSRKDALNACKTGPFGTDPQEYLLLSEDFAWEENGRIFVTGGPHTSVRTFPALPEERLPGFVKSGEEGRFTVYERTVAEDGARAEVRPVCCDGKKAVYEITISYAESLRGTEQNSLPAEGRDTLLCLSYAGDRMAVYLGETKINDHFYTGQEVPISLRYFDFPQKLRVEVEPLLEGAPVYLEKYPAFENGAACRLEKIRVQELYW